MVPVTVRLFGHEGDRLCVLPDRQVAADITFGGSELLCGAMVADRQMRHDLRELTAVGRIIRERRGQTLGELPERRRWLRPKPQDASPEPTRASKLELERLHSGENPSERGEDPLVDVFRCGEREQDSYMRRHAERGLRI